MKPGELGVALIYCKHFEPYKLIYDSLSFKPENALVYFRLHERSFADSSFKIIAFLSLIFFLINN